MPHTWTGRPLENPVRNYWLGKRGLDHFKSKPVITPHGLFGSLSQAALFYGLSKHTAWRKAHRGTQGYRDDEWKWL